MTEDATHPAFALKTRIAEIDRRFDAATGWGSWMVSAANEREALVNRLKRDFGIAVAHKNRARTESGGRVS